MLAVSSFFTFARIARAFEQGLGRSVRGEKDYSVIILMGADLVNAIRSNRYKRFLSGQTKLQVDLGLEISEYAQEDVAKNLRPIDSLKELIDQCLKRDDNWKAFYTERMNALAPEAADRTLLEVYEKELEAELLFQQGKIVEAIAKTQEIVDKHIRDQAEVGWYLQEMARYRFRHSVVESNKQQAEAHHKNHYLLKPDSGMVIERLTLVSQKRMENIIHWIGQLESFEEVQLTIQDILSRLDFGVKAEPFESALHELGGALGFASQRPDKEWKEGPDNLWAVSDNKQILFECKSEVDEAREEIVKAESGQMNNACAWAEKNYAGVERINIMIIPTNALSAAAGFNQTVYIMSRKQLSTLRKNVAAFFKEFANQDFGSLSESKLQEWVIAHKLTVDDWIQEYTRPVRTPGPLRN